MQHFGSLPVRRRALYRSHLDLATVQGLPQDVLASGADPDLEAIVYYLFPDKLSAAGKAAFEAARAKRAEVRTCRHR